MVQAIRIIQFLFVAAAIVSLGFYLTHTIFFLLGRRHEITLMLAAITLAIFIVVASLMHYFGNHRWAIGLYAGGGLALAYLAITNIIATSQLRSTISQVASSALTQPGRKHSVVFYEEGYLGTPGGLNLTMPPFTLSVYALTTVRKMSVIVERRFRGVTQYIAYRAASGPDCDQGDALLPRYPPHPLKGQLVLPKYLGQNDTCVAASLSERPHNALVVRLDSAQNYPVLNVIHVLRIEALLELIDGQERLLTRMVRWRDGTADGASMPYAPQSGDSEVLWATLGSTARKDLDRLRHHPR